MQRLVNPYPLFVDGRGALVDAGYIYVGIPDTDPRSDPVALFTDPGLTIPIAQPLRTLGGFIVNGENPTFVYMAEDDYALRVEDANHQLVEYVPSAVTAAADYQPHSATLDLLAALSTTSYGRALLTLANQAALQAAVGLPASLPLTGGIMTGGIIRQGGGAYTYLGDATLTSGKITVSPASGGNPTSQPGEIWFGTAS